MGAKPDPQVPMHRYMFTKLGESQIGAALGTVTIAADDRAARLQRLEDEAAIRAQASRSVSADYVEIGDRRAIARVALEDGSSALG